MPRRDPLPSLASIARQLTPKAKRAMQRVARRHGPLGLSVPATDSAEGWLGPVERRDPREYQAQSTVGIVRCPTCFHWRDEAPAAKCSTCGVFSLAAG